MTSYEAVYGQAPPIITLYITSISKVRAVDLALVTRDDILYLLKDNLQIAQHHMKQQAD